ncbi:hypothetical protein H3Z83_07140 [Tenacibaculum sp. S7007]|uniref:Uncharacterized protein n=1 Tax=Tenacibaculum pelagium TaxID=2759527 RepID=A0A839AP59_9FLAO|nr:hypothetical protein [Tenacibaculum pelagium]MBA6156286.1 hypothetical protein [Tenacibaculum pelagium]
MGEIIKKFGAITIAESDIDFELNKPHAKGGLNSVHIQSNKMRIEMDEKEFLKLSLTILEAEKKLKRLKGL